MILVLGYGNTTRSDDGVGIYIAEKIAAQNLPRVEVQTAQQLQIELVEEMTRYHEVYLIDASSEGSPFSISKLEAVDSKKSATSHGVDVAFLVQLMKKLHIKHPDIYLCTVKGRNFDFGENLSPEVRQNANQLFEEISKQLISRSR